MVWINPPCKKFVVFSGGGGLVSRSQQVEVPPGRSRFDIADVPASFDLNTTTVEVIGAEGAVELVQVDVRRPDKRIMDQFISREKQASDSIIQSSTDLRGANREKIIQICESAYYRRYEDMLGTISVIVDAKGPAKFTLQVKYFVEDSRIKWRPSIHVHVDPKTKRATIEGHLQVMNNSGFAFENVDLGFAQFDLQYDVGEEGFLDLIEAEQAVQTMMSKPQMLKRMKRASMLEL
ncbi:MAG: hypothetical protein ACTSU5_14420 [Promethearchaeota archaeon]